MQRFPVFAFVASVLASMALAQTNPSGKHIYPRAAERAGVTDVSLSGTDYLLTWTSPDGTSTVQYKIPTAHMHVQAGLLRIEETTTSTVPMSGGGLSVRLPSGELDPIAFALHANHTVTALTHSLDAANKTVVLDVTETFTSPNGLIPFHKTFKVSIVGAALRIFADADELTNNKWIYGYSGFRFGEAGTGFSQAQPVHIPYMDSIPILRTTNNAFGSWFIDWNFSNASDVHFTDTTTPTGVRLEVGSSYYNNDLGKVLAPVEEVAYLTVSKRIEDVFTVIDNPPSPYRGLLAGRLMTLCGPGINFSDATEWIDTFGGVNPASSTKGLGLDQFTFQKWDWSKWIFNFNDPDILPVGTAYGTPGDFAALVGAANAQGHLMNLYFEGGINDPGYSPPIVINLICAPTPQVTIGSNPTYDPGASVRDANNIPKGGWNTADNLADMGPCFTLVSGGTGHVTEVYAPHMRADLISCQGSQLMGSPIQPCPLGMGSQFPPYAFRGLFVDAKTGVPGWNQIDQMSGSSLNHTIRDNVRSLLDFFQAGRDTMQGPLFGENNHNRATQFETYQAGLLDGTSRKIPTNWLPVDPLPDCGDYLVVPDFELRQVLPKATGFYGMGWEGHFDSDASPVFKDAFIDAWHATVVSYGHAGFLGNNGMTCSNFWSDESTIKTYYLLQGLQSRYHLSPVKQIQYVHPSTGAVHDLTSALGAGLDLNNPRLHVRYENDLEIFANHSPKPGNVWVVVSHGVTYHLPTNGFVATDGSGFVAYSGLNVGAPGSPRVDYAKVPGEYEMIDFRGQVQGFNGFPGAIQLPTNFPPAMSSCNQVPAPSSSNLVVVRNDLHGMNIFAVGFEVFVEHTANPPSVVGLEIKAVDVDKFSAGRPQLGFTAGARLSNNALRDVTALATWTSSAPSVVAMNHSGAGTMKAAGSADITAQFQSMGSNVVRVTAQLNPVVSGITVTTQGSTKALVEFQTDVGTACSIQYRRLGTSAWTTVNTDAGPSKKVHWRKLSGLIPTLTYQYQVTATASNLQTTTTPIATFVAQ